MIAKIIGALVCLTAILTQARAQEIGVELNAGLQGLQYSLQNGQNKQQPGGSLGVNYTFRLTSRLGFLTGISGGLYRTQASLRDGLVLTYGEVDDGGSAFQYNVKVTGYKESQRFFAASIPLLLQFHTIDADIQWYVNGGAKVFIPFHTSIQASAQQLSMSGYYPDFNIAVSNLPQHGFGTLNNWSGSTSSDLKPAAALSAASGVSFVIRPGMRLYTGLFLDYGLTKVNGKNSVTSLATYSSSGINGVKVNSVLDLPGAGPAKIFSFGLQARLTIGASKEKPAYQPKKIGSQQPTQSTLNYDEAAIIQAPIVFGFVGETAVPEIQKAHLEDVVNLLKQYPEVRIIIEGHYCDSETETENKGVGAARARAVARYLREKGIDRNRISVTSAGESDPVQPGNPAVNHQNRRAVITIK
jgi:outer membrane protein OmpA-like peptidoglycan-associated protein